MIENKSLVNTLKRKIPDTSFSNRLKIAYRPYICPFDQILDDINEESSLYDVGCGSGMFLMLVAEYRNPTKLGGVEINKELINNAEELLSGYKIPLSLSVYDGKQIPDIAAYDYISMIDVFHHIPKSDQYDFLSRLYSGMGKGSKLLFKDIDKSSPLVVFNKLHDLVFAGEIGNEVSGDEMKNYLESLGFKINYYKTRNTLWYPHYWMEAVKE